MASKEEKRRIVEGYATSGMTRREYCAKLDPEQWRDPEEDRPGVLEKIRSDSRMLAALRGENGH